MKIFKDSTIFEVPMWICLCEGYMYESETIEGLIEKLNTEWKHDKHMIG